MSQFDAIRLATAETVLPENKAYFEKVMALRKQRAESPKAVAEALQKAYAQGGVELVNRQRINPIIEEALIRGWALELGVRKPAKPGDLPIYRTRSRAKVSVSEVAPNGKSIIKRYANANTFATGSWSEISTDPIEYDIFNPLFPDAGAENEAEAHEEAAYQLSKDLHKRVKTIIDAGIGSLGADVWTYKDADVKGLPTTNALDSTGDSNKIEGALKKVIHFFTGQGKANNGEVIDLHISVEDEDAIWALAPFVQAGGYTSVQQQIADSGNILKAYGHNFRIVKENTGVDAGYLYASVGRPAFELFLMDMGEFGGVQDVRPEHPRKRAFIATQMLCILQPAPYKSNYCQVKFA